MVMLTIKLFKYNNESKMCELLSISIPNTNDNRLAKIYIKENLHLNLLILLFFYEDV